MKTFQEFLLECYSIQETSLTRVMSKSQRGGMAILSGQRGDKSKKENKARSARTEKRIRGAGLPGPTKVSGRYTENLNESFGLNFTVCVIYRFDNFTKLPIFGFTISVIGTINNARFAAILLV